MSLAVQDFSGALPFSLFPCSNTPCKHDSNAQSYSLTADASVRKEHGDQVLVHREAGGRGAQVTAGSLTGEVLLACLRYEHNTAACSTKSLGNKHNVKPSLVLHLSAPFEQET